LIGVSCYDIDLMKSNSIQFWVVLGLLNILMKMEIFYIH